MTPACWLIEDVALTGRISVAPGVVGLAGTVPGSPAPAWAAGAIAISTREAIGKGANEEIKIIKAVEIGKRKTFMFSLRVKDCCSVDIAAVVGEIMQS
jgi:hypothetical protein